MIEKEVGTVQETAVESSNQRESAKEQALSEQAKRAERRDRVFKDIQSAQKSVRNIAVHTQQVLSAVAAIRSALSLQGNASIPSLEIDQKRLDSLKKKIVEHVAEIKQMRQDFVDTKAAELLKQFPEWSQQQILQKSESDVDELFKDLGVY